MVCVSLATPVTEACDAVGGAFRPQWREWPAWACEESRSLNLNPVMRMVRAYLCRFVPSISASCNSGYNRLHGTQFAKGLAGRFCLSVVHLVLDGSCLSGCRGG